MPQSGKLQLNTRNTTDGLAVRPGG